jgi:ubiquinone/menaquinone biosynthesis C-methylase UbiE
MLMRGLLTALLRESRIARRLRVPVWKMFYNLSRQDNRGSDLMDFMNLGYLAEADAGTVDDTVEIIDHLSERLYDRVVEGVELEDRTVLEVGCGPGAGSAHMAAAYGPASLLGIDLSNDMISWCREHHAAANLSFEQGNAQDLPVATGSVDVVVNVESSHCYPSRLRFFEEVKRVLRPGGSFVCADIIVSPTRKKEAQDTVSPQLKEAGLALDNCTDITENVMAARSAVSRSQAFQALFREKTPAVVAPFVEECIFLPGSNAYARMASREVIYLLWTASKPGDSLATPNVAGTVGAGVE